MHPKILPTFWSDLDFERYEGQELTNMRMAFIWAITGPTTNEAGIFLFSRTFPLDTGLPLEWLHRIVQAFPRAILYDEPSRQALLRRYISIQIAEGDKLMNNGNMCVAIANALRRSTPPLASEVFRLHPELTLATVTREGKKRPVVSPTEALAKCFHSPTEALAKPLPETDTADTHSSPVITGPDSVPRGTILSLSPSPAQGLGKPSAQAKATEKEKAQAPAPAEGDARGGRPSPEVLIPSLDEVIAHGDRLGVDPATCERFHAYHESRGWMSGQTPLVKPLSLLKRYAEEHRTVKKPASPSRRSDTTGPSADDLRAALQTERDPQKRADLEKQLAGGAA